jgi:hypothetical protein
MTRYHYLRTSYNTFEIFDRLQGHKHPIAVAYGIYEVEKIVAALNRPE